MFSLCGRLQKTRNFVYQFDLALYKTQLYECNRNYLVQLEEPHQLHTRDFVIKFSCKEAIKLVTVRPVFPCLNKQINSL
ncbi:hypothetical protein EB796_013475 [Bugula neritina]|uniref:Uncharacterized protein n=1 Tax=Bugula neritina TaxID=10212 RepID=A0A7J7JRZ1_BUGNE|nr:hypothetical protein EB796_013475 [Bugula neritina]